jgi:hypothetical protein
LSQKSFHMSDLQKNVWIYDGKFYDLLYFPAHNWGSIALLLNGIAVETILSVRNLSFDMCLISAVNLSKFQIILAVRIDIYSLINY